ncbi:MAG: clostripain-related cysteine peptidase, partial [Thermoplasmata archaeon]|nr:clostripain-related cysteine peptidase [Thermoplasmata archaeon]
MTSSGHARIFSVLLIASIAIGSAGVLPVQAADPVPLWTVMIYLDSDNNLEPAGVDDFLEISSAGSTSEVNLLVQMDRWDGSPPPADDTSYGNWQGAMRFLVENGMTPDDSNALEDLGEVDMADPATLTDFIDWGVANYPAENYALVLWDHGGGWMGLISDEYSDSFMDMGELTTALADASADNGGLVLDILGFDACLMAGVEVASQVSDYADIMVASEVTIPWNGWNYNASLWPLVQTPSMTAVEFAQIIVDGYVESYSAPLAGYSLMDITLSSTDLSLSPAVETAVDALATALLADLGGYVNY